MAITEYGTCKYCKQRVLVQIPGEGDVPEDYADDVASEECTCTKAREERDKKNAKSEAFSKISMLFDDYSDAKNLLVEAVQPLISTGIESISIKIDKKTKATMKITSKGKIRVEKTITSGQVEEI